MLQLLACVCRCPAAGTAISLCCDYRVMTDTGRIGLNEVELGIPVPKFWGLLMGRVIGAGVADKLCGFAQMCTPQRALQVGMLDEVASGGQLLQVRPARTAHHLLGVPIDVSHPQHVDQLHCTFSSKERVRRRCVPSAAAAPP